MIDDDACAWTSQGHARGGPIACARAKASVVDFDACGASARSPAISNRRVTDCEHGLVVSNPFIHSFNLGVAPPPCVQSSPCDRVRACGAGEIRIAYITRASASNAP